MYLGLLAPDIASSLPGWSLRCCCSLSCCRASMGLAMSGDRFVWPSISTLRLLFLVEDIVLVMSRKDSVIIAMLLSPFGDAEKWASVFRVFSKQASVLLGIRLLACLIRKFCLLVYEKS